MHIVHIVSGTKPQVIPAFVCVDFPMELFALATGTHGVSSREYAVTFCCLPHVLQVSIYNITLGRS